MQLEKDSPSWIWCVAAHRTLVVEAHLAMLHQRVAQTLPRAQQARLGGTERDPFLRPLDGSRPVRPHDTRADVLDRIEAIEAFQRTGQLEAWLCPLHTAGGRSILKIRDQLWRASIG